MKAAKFLGTVAIFLAIPLSIPSALAATVGYWRFEPGNLTLDSSGNGHTLINSNVTSSVDLAPNAPGGGSALFGGGSHMRTAATLNLTNFTTLTIEWYQKTSTTADAGVLTHSAGSIYSPPSGGFSAFLNDGAIPGNFSFIEEALNGTAINIVETPFASGTWQHYAVTIDSAQTGANRVKLYKNYTQVGTYGTTTATFIPFLNDTLFFGTIGGTGFFYDGLLDEVRISDQILAPGDFIPEPTTAALALLGLATVALRRRVTRKV